MHIIRRQISNTSVFPWGKDRVIKTIYIAITLAFSTSLYSLTLVSTISITSDKGNWTATANVYLPRVLEEKDEIDATRATTSNTTTIITEADYEQIGFDSNFTNFAIARHRRRSFAKPAFEFFDSEKGRKERDNVTWALASLALNTPESVARAHDLMLYELNVILNQSTIQTLETTVEGPLVLRMRSWNRIYYLYSSKSKFPETANRISPKIEQKIENVFYWFAYQRSLVELANPKNIWFIEDASENHDIMMKMNCYLAVQALQHVPAYKNSPLLDNALPAQHTQAWERYYRHYAFERARTGLIIETASPPCGKWVIGELVNIYEFSESPRVRRLFEQLLHVIWADYAIDQFQGWRAGPKARSYPVHAYESRHDSYSMIAREMLGVESQFFSHSGMQSQLILHTSAYELPNLVMDVIFNKGNYEPFVYRSTRPANRNQIDYMPSTPAGMPGIWMDPTVGKILRYSYQTQTYNMGTWMIDTQLNYTDINGQNRFQGVSFSTSTVARIFPWSVTFTQGGRSSYNVQVAVQHRNAMLVQNNPTKANDNKSGPRQLRVFFPEHTHGQLMEIAGWVIVKEGNAWLGVRMLNNGYHPGVKNYIFKKEDGTTEGAMNGGYWMWPEQESYNTLALFVASQVKPHCGVMHHETLEDFMAYLSKTRFYVEKGRAKAFFLDDVGHLAKMELDQQGTVPIVNGQPVDLEPAKLFDSPWMQSDYGSALITLSKDDQKLVWDFRLDDDEIEQLEYANYPAKANIHASTLSSLKRAIKTTHKKISSTNLDLSSGKGAKKYFVFHVGPQKTASTFIQSRSLLYQNTTLKVDNYGVVIKIPDGRKQSVLYDAILDKKCRNLVQQARAAGQATMPSCWDGIVEGVKTFGDQNILFSSEDLEIPKTAETPEWWAAFKELCTELGYHLIVVVVYRRLYEWLPSAHSQMFYPAARKTHLATWPDQGGHRIPALYTMIKSNQYVERKYGIQNMGSYSWTGGHLPAIPEDIETRIMSLYGDPMTTTGIKFFCNAVPDAALTCQKEREAASQYLAGEEKANPSRNVVVYDMLTTAAADAGLIDTSKYSRLKVWRAAEKRHVTKLAGSKNVFEWNCPSLQDLEPILEASLEWEKEIMPGMNDELGHRQDFQELVERGMFCVLDTTKTLAKPVWKKFFGRFKKNVESDDRNRAESSNVLLDRKNEGRNYSTVNYKVKREKKTKSFFSFK